MYLGGIAYDPIGAIYLLVGRIDNIGAQNLSDPSSRWITIGRQTGSVLTAENYPQGSDLGLKRQFARSGVGMQGT